MQKPKRLLIQARNSRRRSCVLTLRVLPRSVAGNRFKSPIIMKLYVGNFSFDMTERTLRELFEPFGTVSEVKLITDRETGQSRGFGFVTMGNVSEGNAAMKGLDGKDKGGRKFKVNEARAKDERGDALFLDRVANSSEIKFE